MTLQGGMVYCYTCKFLLLLLLFNFFKITSISAQQRIKEFYLSDWSESKKKWELRGREALVFDKYVDIEKLEAKYFLKNRIIDLKSNKGRIIKPMMEVYLKDNVKVKTSDGINLLSSSLAWKKNLLFTQDRVELKRDNLKIVAKGLKAEENLEKVNFQKEVKVDLYQKDNKIVITCLGPLEIDYNQAKAVFNKNVIVTSKEGEIEADKGIVYFDKNNRTIIKIVCEGDVRIKREGNISFAERATYLSKEKKIILEGNPRLVIFPKQ